MRRSVASMLVAQVAPGPLLRRHGSAAPTWLSSWSPFFVHRRFHRASPPPASSGCRRQDQDDPNSSDVSVEGSSDFKPAHEEWVEETRRLFYLKTANNVINMTFVQNMREHVLSKSIVNGQGQRQALVGHRMVNQHVQSVPAPVSVENKEKDLVVKKVVSPLPTKAAFSEESLQARKALASIYDKVLVVDNIESARSIVKLLTTKYKSFIHACHTEVADIDAKEKRPVGHGEVICFSIYSASSDVQEADFGNGKTCIWVDVLDGGRGVLMEFAPFFEDPSIKKVCH